MSERTIAAGYRSSAILALGGDLAQATAMLVEPVAGIYRLVGWEVLPLVLRDGTRYKLPDRLVQACRQLGRRLGRPLWQVDGDGPFTEDPEPALGLALEQSVAAVDPMSPLRVWIAGLGAGESLAAVQEALTSTPCEPVALYRLRPGEDVARLAAELAHVAPDVIVVSGGYDQPGAPARQPVLALCDLVGLAVRRLHPHRRPLLCFAGNRWAASAALDLWREISGIEVQAVLNVHPSPSVVHSSALAAALAQYAWARCKAQPVLQRIANWITPPAVPRSLHWSFAQAVRLWREFHNLPNLHGLYCGHRRWMHVWSTAAEVGVRVRFVQPGMRPAALAHWPPLSLVSGAWPDGLWPRPARAWIDPLGLAPIAANLGQIDLEAALHVLAQDLFSS